MGLSGWLLYVARGNRLHVMNEFEYPSLTELKDRLSWARKKAKLSQGQLGKRVGLSTPAISRLENGHDKKTAFATQIAAACAVDPIWLATGKMPKSGTHVTHLQFANEIQSLNNQAGAVKIWPELLGERKMTDKFLFRLDGDLMHGSVGPSIPPGSFITVDPSQKPKHGCVFLASYQGEPVVGTLRTLGSKTYLRPSNDQYPAIQVDQDSIIGMVTDYSVKLPQ